MKGVKELTGLVVDEVVDRVPSTEVNTGAALHFDSPNTEAPQTFLLAMPPEGESWSYAVMMDTVRDAFQLAKMRAVDGHMTSHLNQLMPAIYASKSTLWGAK